jgi:hypothetical protein
MIILDKTAGALYQGRKLKLIERRFILLFEVLPIDDKDDYYAESARPRVKKHYIIDVSTCKPYQHPLYSYYTTQPKENLHVLPDLRHPTQ